jgi:hypothetical protein
MTDGAVVDSPHAQEETWNPEVSKKESRYPEEDQSQKKADSAKKGTERGLFCTNTSRRWPRAR